MKMGTTEIKLALDKLNFLGRKINIYIKGMVYSKCVNYK